MKILGLSGSLRAGSFNTALLHAAGELLPDGVTLEVLEYGDVPFYNADLPRPESVNRAVVALAAADALLFASPEYNFSVSGVLKNLIDWLSRPAPNLPENAVPLKGVPTGMVSASPGLIGGARGQQHLKVILLSCGVPVFPGAEVVVGQAQTKLVDGKLVDEATRKFLGSYVTGFAAWAGRNPR